MTTNDSITTLEIKKPAFMFKTLASGSTLQHHMLFGGLSSLLELYCDTVNHDFFRL